MLKIRLQRVGRTHEPSFRLVLTDSQNGTKSGKYLEVLGNYDARHGHDSKMNTERVTYWMSKGAQVSDTVHNMLVDKKVISEEKINKLPLKKAIVKEKAEEVAPKAHVVSSPKAEVTPEVVEEVSAPVETAPLETEVTEEVTTE